MRCRRRGDDGTLACWDFNVKMGEAFSTASSSIFTHLKHGKGDADWPSDLPNDLHAVDSEIGIEGWTRAYTKLEPVRKSFVHASTHIS